MTAAKAFIDTNILLYGIDSSDPGRQAVVSELLVDLADSGMGVISQQIVHEFASNLLKKFGRSPAEAVLLCEGLRVFGFASTNLDSAKNGLRIMSTASLSFWDACVISAASMAGCKVLYSEDLKSGEVISGVMVVNPFA